MKLLKRFRFLGLAVLVFSSSCSAQESSGHEYTKSILVENKELDAANNELFKILGMLVFGEKHEIDFRAARVWPAPSLVGKTFVDGRCRDDFPILNLGEGHALRDDFPTGLALRGSNGSFCNYSRGGRPVPWPLREDGWYEKQYIEAENRYRNFAISYKQFIVSEDADDPVVRAFGPVDKMSFEKFSDGYFAKTERCQLFLEKTHRGLISNLLLIYRYQDANGFDYSAGRLVKNLDFLECAYRSRLVAFGMQGGASIPAEILLAELKVIDTGSIDRIEFDQNPVPLMFGLYHRLVRNNFLKNGKLSRSKMAGLKKEFLRLVPDGPDKGNRLYDEGYEMLGYFAFPGTMPPPKVDRGNVKSKRKTRECNMDSPCFSNN